MGVLSRIDRERMVQEVEQSLAVLSADPDAGQMAKNRLGDLKAALDEAEDAVKWPALVAESEKLISGARNVIREHGNNDDTRVLESHETEVKGAVQTHDSDILRRRIEELRSFAFRVLDRKGIMQAVWFQDLNKLKAQMRDQAMAEQLISQGQRAINTNDIEGLRAVNRQLASLLPTPPPPPNLSTVL
jgi:molecular chaperone DnaK